MPGELESTATARLIFDASSVRQGTRDAQQALGSLYEVVRDNWWGIRNVGLAFTAAGAAIAGGVAVAVRAAADFEQGMAGVARTTYDASKSAEENATQVAALGDELRRVAQTRPVDLGTITTLAEQAGALGVASEDVAAFTETVTDLVATTNLTAESAPKLARLAGVFGLTAGQYKNLGAAIFETGRKTAATETEILNMSTRLAGAGKAAGLTADEVVALSAATLSLGPRAEAAASALQRTLGDFASAAADADPTQLENFAIVADTTAKRFKELIRTDPAQALTKFITGLGEMGTDAVSAQETLRTLGITEVRQIQALQALAAGTKNTANENVNLKNTFELSNQAYKEGTAVTDAAAKQYQTLSNQLIILQNNVHEVFLSFGTLFLPVIKDAVGLAKDFATGLAFLDPALKGIAAGVTGAVGGVALLAGGFLLLAPRVVLAQDAFGKLVSSMRVSIGTAALLNAETSGLGANSLRNAFAAGTNAKAQAAEAAALGASRAAELLDAEAALANARAQQVLAEVSALRVKLSQSSVFVNVEERRAIELKIIALEAEAVALGQSARAAAANAAAQRLSTVSMGAGTVAAYGLGAAMRFLTGPIGIIITMLGLAAGAVALFGHEQDAARSAAQAYAAVDEELVSALQQEAAGHVGAVRAVLAHRLAMTGAIGIARQYGISIQVLMATIRGESAATAQFISAIRGAYANGEAGAQQLAHQVQDLAASYSASVKAARDQQAAIGKAAAASGDASDRFKDLKNNSEDATKAMKDQAQAANDLVGAMIGVKDANFAVQDAELALQEARRALKNQADEIEKAEISLARARNAQQDAVQKVRRAEEDLATARARQAQIVADAQSDLADAQDKAIDSAIKVTEAEDALKKLQMGPTLDEIRDATNKLANARLALNKSNKLVSDSEWYLQYLIGEGASQRDITDASDSLNAARQDVLDQTDNVIDSEAELQDTLDGASQEELAKAERDLAAARRDSVKAAEDLTEAQKNLNDALADQKNDTLFKQAEDDLASARLDARDAALALKDAEHDLRDARSSTDEIRAVRRAEQNLTQALYRQAKARVELQKANAIAAGKEFTAADEARAMAKQLRKLGATASGPVRRQLLQYARTIEKNIPKDISSKIGLDLGGGTGIGAGGGGSLGKIPGGKLLPDLLDTYDTRLDQFKDDHKGFWGSLFSKEGWENSLEGWNMLGAWIRNELPTQLSDAFTHAWDFLKDVDWSSITSDAWNFFSDAWSQTWTPAAVGDLVSGIGGWFSNAWSNVSSWFSGLPSAINNALSGANQWFVEGIINAGINVGQAFADALAGTWNFTSGLANDAKNFFENVATSGWGWFSAKMTQIWDMAGMIAGFIRDQSGNFLNSITTFLGNAADKGWESFISSARAGWNLLGILAGRIDEARDDFFGRLQTFLGNAADKAWEEFISSAKAGWNLLGVIGGRIDAWRADVWARIATFGAGVGGHLWSGLQSGIRNAADNFTTWFAKFLKGKGLAGIARGVFSTVAAALKSPFNVVIGAFNRALSAVGNISFKVPKWVPGVGGNTFGFPTFHITPLAEGGILNRPTFMAGEAGAEAVIPLDKLLSMFQPVEGLVLQLQAQNEAIMALLGASGGGDGGTNITHEGDDIDFHVYDKTSPSEIADELHWRKVTRR